MKKKLFEKSGVSLIEVVLYFGIVGVVLLALMNFSIQILKINSLSNNYHEIQSNLDFMANRIVSTIQTATSVDEVNSIFDNDEGKLSLNMIDGSKSPTQFKFSDGDIIMKEGSSSEVKISSDWVKFTKFRFHRVTYSKAPDQIVFDAHLTPVNPGVSDINKEMDLHLSVNLRNL